MKFSFHSNRGSGLTALFSLLLLSIPNIAIAATLPQHGVSEKSLDARAPVKGSVITFAEYVAYLNKYYPETDKYIEYSGYAEDQVKKFQAQNPGYYYYEDFFNAYKSKHYFTAFPEKDDRMDDAEESGRAISTVAKGKITVFGAVHWQKSGTTSFYATTEAKTNQEGVRTGRLQSINHMVQDATKPTQILAKEDGKGVITYQPGYKIGTANTPHTCKRASTPKGRKMKPGRRPGC